MSLAALGTAALAAHEAREALADFHRALEAASGGYQVSYPGILEGLAMGADQQGDHEDAIAFAHAADDARLEMGAPRPPSEVHCIGPALEELMARPCQRTFPSLAEAVAHAMAREW